MVRDRLRGVDRVVVERGTPGFTARETEILQALGLYREEN